MYIILDTQLKRLATIDAKSDQNMFYGDTLTRQIADSSTSSDEISGVSTFNSTDPNANSKMWNDSLEGLTMVATDKAAGYLHEGYHLAKYDEYTDRWRIYRIHTVTENVDPTSGVHLVSVSAINLAIWKLGKTIPKKKEIKECRLKDAMSWIMAGTGWTLENNATSGLFADISFDGSTTSQAMLQTVLTSYDCEADAYAHFDQSGLVDDLILELTDELGQNNGQTITYGDNALNIERQTVDSTMVTKLYVFGADGQSISGSNNGKDFITDSKANALYNHDKNTWLEGTITSDTITEPKALLDWGIKQLKIFNHPRINYTVEPTADFQPHLGDTIKVIDLKMFPVLTIQARVIQVTTSEADPTQNKITLGEFATVNVVTPSFIKNMEQRWNDHVKKLFEDARKNANAASVSLITPNGASWANTDTSKQIIARLFIEGENVTSFLSPGAFNWQKINTDGTHDMDWESQHRKDGYEVLIVPPFVGTLLVTIDDEFVRDEAEIWIDTAKTPDGSFPKLWESATSRDYFNGKHYGGVQYAYILSDNTVLGSYARSNDVASDTLFMKYDMAGNIIATMWLKGGGHAGSFGYDEASNLIYTNVREMSADSYTSWICTVPFQNGKYIDHTDSSVKKLVQVDKYYRISVDKEHGLLMGSDTAGQVVICKLQDLQAGNFQPNIEFNLKDFGWNPLPSGTVNDGGFNTVQANGLYYPYAFFTAGDVNNADERLIMGVNVITHSMVFNYSVTPMQDIKLSVPVENGGHFEPEGVYYDAQRSRLVVGFGISEMKGDSLVTAVSHSALYEFPIGWRDDSKDFAVEYPVEDPIPANYDDEYPISPISKINPDGTVEHSGAIDINSVGEDDANASDPDFSDGNDDSNDGVVSCV
ncbi:phage tail spike protein [Secundilactobacillus kimchicus]|uniref:phage tail spike protein n=1 Tax=Secundilactobacillus kimchicus TaxID=528209 RepID=UPI0024A80912|nr:phage tail spike protein [Secundilactobacillus kimchicus]